MVALVDKEKWARTVGMFILSMGSIEHAASQCLREWAAYNAKDTLHARLKSISRLLSTKEYSSESKAFFEMALNDAEDLRSLRNTVAHQPLALRVFHPDAPVPLLEGIHDLETSGRSLSLEDIQEAALQAESVSSRMNEAMAKLRSEDLNRPRALEG